MVFIVLIVNNIMLYAKNRWKNLEIQTLKHFKTLDKREKSTGLTTHCLDYYHIFSIIKIKFICPAKKGLCLNLLEHLEIKR